MDAILHPVLITQFNVYPHIYTGARSGIPREIYPNHAITMFALHTQFLARGRPVCVCSCVFPLFMQPPLHPFTGQNKQHYNRI